MRVVRSFDEIGDPSFGSAVAVGVFDGVHLGHREIIRRVMEHAGRSHGRSVVCTFDPHPRSVLKTVRSPRLLTLIDEKIRLLGDLGVEILVVLHFSPELASLSAEEFIRNGLIDKVGLQHLVVGYDFRLGHGREGNEEVLGGLGKSYGFQVDRIPPLMVDGKAVKSTWIRDELEAGNVKGAAQLLHRCYSLSGSVVRGDGRGRNIGFPTANLGVEEIGKLWPAYGVYAIVAEIGDELYPAIANVGIRPTFASDGGPTVEAHLLDFRGELKESAMTVHFIERIREESIFPSAKNLADQIARDREKALQIFRDGAEKIVFTQKNGFVRFSGDRKGMSKREDA